MLMAIRLVNLGRADKGDGDPLRVAFDKINQNFTEMQLDQTGLFDFEGNTMFNNTGVNLSNRGQTTGATAQISLPADGGANVSILNNYGTITLTTASSPGNQKTFIFDTDGGLIFPDGTKQTTALSFDFGSILPKEITSPLELLFYASQIDMGTIDSPTPVLYDAGTLG
jgi:hypothetical protein